VEELLELKDRLLHGDIPSAIAIVEDLEEMSRSDKINNIRSHGKVLLLHLIKQEAEGRSTKSWQVSIRNSVLEIQEKNKRRKTKGVYLQPEELREVLEAAYRQAVNVASLEVAGGCYDVGELERQIDRDKIIDRALDLIENNAD